MSRYIDADALIARIAGQMSYEIEVETGNETDCVDLAEELLNDIPSIYIVRCKECRHWIGETEHYEDREYKACWQLCGQYMDSEFWCKYGEREGE